LLAQGRLPHFQGLIAGGVRSPLKTIWPTISPAIWTTIATGKSPHEHGVEAFLSGRQRRPVTSATRSAEAIWNIASAAGRTTGVVGWLVSWPAEEVNGFVVSAYVQYAGTAKEKAEGRTGWTYPAPLVDEIAPLVLRPEAVPPRDVERFLDAPIDPAALDAEMEQRLATIRWCSANDLGFTRIAERLYRERRPDLFSVYLRGADVMGHSFWNYAKPEAVRSGLADPRGLPYFKGTMRAYYRYTDELVGRIIALADDRTTILVVSDHGFKGGPGGGVEQHTLDGVLLMAGHDVRRGNVAGASVYDLAPTMLVLMGLRPAKDMRGAVLWSALDPAIRRDAFTPIVSTYETGRRERAKEAPPGPADDEMVEQLRSLGYVE
jgi:predicted AlkP superfamily phosphohydrolase/phosphomutase